MRSISLLFVASFWLLMATNLWAQQATIRGQISDAEDGIRLVGASVRLLDGDRIVTGGNTDLDGDFTVKAKPGTYQLIASYVSYQSDTIAVIASTGEVTTIRISLSSSGSSLEAVNIVADGNRRTSANAVTRKINSINTLDIISADLFVRTGAFNAADVLQMAPAVTITEGKYINVRGLSDRYNRTLINLGEIPPLDPDRETVQMDRFPSAMIDNITVYKTFTPDLPGAFSAGLIDIQTRSHPLEFELNFSATVLYNTVSSLQRDFLHHEGGSLDWIGLNDDTRGSLLRSEEEAQAGIDNEETFYPITRRTSPLNQIYSFSIGNQHMLWGRPLGYVVALTYQNQWQNRADYEVGRYDLNETGGAVSSQNATFADGSGFSTGQDVLAGSIVNLSYKLGLNSKLKFTYLHNHGSEKGTSQLVGQNTADFATDPLRQVTEASSFISRRLDAFQLNGDHRIELDPSAKLPQLEIDWIATHSFSATDQPDFQVQGYLAELDPIVETQDSVVCLFEFEGECVAEQEIEIRDTVGVDTTTNRQLIAGSAGSQTGRIYRALTQETTDGKLNITLPFALWTDPERIFQVKTGAAYTRRFRFFNELGNGFQPQNPNADWQATSTSLFDGGSVAGFLETFPFDELDDVGNEAGGPGIPYEAGQTILAGYAMLETSPLRWLSFIGGMRYEYTDQFIDGNADGINNIDQEGGRDGGYTVNDFLPALHMIVKPFRNFNLRMNYSRTVVRPNFRESSLFVNFNFAGDLRTAGSPSLRRSLIDNLDFRLEWSPGLGEIISVSSFYKEILGPIELVNLSESILVYQNLRTGPDTEPINPIIPKNLNDDLTGDSGFNPAAGSDEEFGPLSVALAYGFEFELRKNFGFLGQGWERFQLWGNYSWLRTEVPLDARSQNNLINEFGDLFPEGEVPQKRRLYGQPTHTANIELAYLDQDKLGLEVSVSYNLFGERITAVIGRGVNVIEQGRGLVNASVRKRLGEHVSVRLRGLNLLDPAYRQTYRVTGTDEDVFVFESFRRGRTYAFEVSLSF